MEPTFDPKIVLCSCAIFLTVLSHENRILTFICPKVGSVTGLDSSLVPWWLTTEINAQLSLVGLVPGILLSFL